MKFSLHTLIATVTLLLFTASCQKELFYTDSCGTLQDSTGICRPSVVAGNFNASTPLTGNNYIDVTVDVTIPGTYRIYSDTVNGYHFNATGYFDNTGTYTVRLGAAGAPQAGGTNVFTIKYCNSICAVSIPVQTGPAPTAQYILGGSPGACTGVIIGSYVQGTPLNSSNVAVADVTVNIPGTYRIYTDTVNGVSFQATGTFSNTGPQAIDLIGSGTPLAPGTYTFTMTGGTTTCTFQLNFLPATIQNQDYFPLTQNSWWTYDSDVAPDTLYKYSSTIASIGPNTYRIFQIGSPGPFGSNAIGTAAFRKSGSDYFEYFTVDSFSTVILDNPVAGEVIFLKENASVGTSWQSTEFTGTENGTPVKIRYDYNIQSTGGNHTVNGVLYNNVIKVNSQSQVNINNTGFTPDLEMESYYARGIGLIEFRLRLSGSPTWFDVQTLRYYTVN